MTTAIVYTGIDDSHCLHKHVSHLEVLRGLGIVISTTPGMLCVASSLVYGTQGHLPYAPDGAMELTNAAQAQRKPPAHDRCFGVPLCHHSMLGHKRHCAPRTHQPLTSLITTRQHILDTS